MHHEHYIDFYLFDSKTSIRNAEEGILVAAGLIVGFGYSHADGCTFDYGLTGITRLERKNKNIENYAKDVVLLLESIVEFVLIVAMYIK